MSEITPLISSSSNESIINCVEVANLQQNRQDLTKLKLKFFGNVVSILLLLLIVFGVSVCAMIYVSSINTFLRKQPE